MIKIDAKLQERLNNLTTKYQKVTEFAKLLPLFANEIIQGEATGEDSFRLSSSYKELPLHWGICWYTNEPANYPEGKVKPDGLVNVYINSYALFMAEAYDLADKELDKLEQNIKVHFYDKMNSTFYFLPEELEDGLEKLNTWYIETKAKVEPYLKQKRKEELKRQLKELE